MGFLIVVEHPRQWQKQLPGTEVVAARDYLTARRFVEMKRARVFNLCRSYSYQSMGYYVSLLAAARGHRALPSVATMQDLRQSALVRIVSEDVEHLLQGALAAIRHDRFELSIYFGRNLAKRYDRLSHALFTHLPMPLLRAEFVHLDRWRLQSLRPIAWNEIPVSHHAFIMEQAERYFSGRGAEPRAAPRYELAILTNPEEDETAPSDDRAIRRFIRAARRFNIRTTMITRHDYGRIPEFDALFIRETTAVNHHTYRFARRASAEGLVVIDDPISILRCSNKVYQAEVFEKHGIPCPRTMIVHRGNISEVAQTLGFPLVLKRPDGSFSTGVEKVNDSAELGARLDSWFRESELVVAQEFSPSNFDWRVGVINRRALYVCRYHMARGHWQIRMAGSDGISTRYGRVESLAVEDAPPEVVRLGEAAAGLMGDGLYGVDIKELEGRYAVIEVNDNPNVESGYEDSVLKDALYEQIISVFYERLEARGSRPAQQAVL